MLFFASNSDKINIGTNYGLTWNDRTGEWLSWVQYGNQTEPAIGTLGVDTNHEHYYEGSNTTSASGGTETRPYNFTIRVWKRTA